MKFKKWPNIDFKNIDFRNNLTNMIWPFSLLVLIVTVVLVYRIKDHRPNRLAAHRLPKSLASTLIEVPPQTNTIQQTAPQIAPEPTQPIFKFFSKKSKKPSRTVASKHKSKKHARHHKHKSKRVAHKKHKKHKKQAYRKHSLRTHSSIAQSPMLVQQ